MPDDRISLRQLLALLFAALLAPAIGVLPSQTAALAGEAGWLSALAALPVLLGLCWVLFALLRPAGEGAGLAQVTETVLGRGLGKGVLLLYLLWGLLLLSANARLFALRFLSTSYRNAPLGLFLLTLLGLTLWLVRKPVRVLARTGEVFYLALAIGLGFSLILGVLQVEPRHILPLWTEDLPGVLSAAVPVLGLFGYVVFAAFLGGNVTRGEGDRRRALWWAAAFCLVLTALQLVCLGNFGPGLTARMDTPFFMMVKGIGIEGTFQRVESVIIALWVFSDLALLNLLFKGAQARRTSSAPAGPGGGLVPLARRLFPGAVDGGPGQDWQPALRLRHSCFAPAGKKAAQAGIRVADLVHAMD